MDNRWSDVPAAARWLGLGGLIPFVSGAAAVHMMHGMGEAQIMVWLVSYGAVILSFMGGCRWGFAAAGLGDGPKLWSLTASVVPALYAWIASLTWWPMAPALLAAGFVALFGADIALARRGGAPTWWPALRLPLTVGAAGSLLLASFA